MAHRPVPDIDYHEFPPAATPGSTSPHPFRRRRSAGQSAPQQVLYFRPDPQRQVSLRPTLRPKADGSLKSNPEGKLAGPLSPFPTYRDFVHAFSWNTSDSIAGPSTNPRSTRGRTAALGCLLTALCCPTPPDSVTDVASGAAWFLLASNDAERLGAVLDRSGWSWSRSKPDTENIMGSTAIAAWNRGSAFPDFAARIVPAKLLAALSQDERSREEVAHAVELLSTALSQYREDAPESRLDIFHDQEAAATGNYNFTIGDIVEERDNENDIRSLFERANRPERYAQRREAIIQSYTDAVKGARQSGAQLLHSYFVALCEAVLRRDASRGIALWRALRQCLVTRFVGRTGIDRLKYAPFMAPDCPAVDAVLGDLYALDEARTDDDLFDIVVAARGSGRVDWLQQMVSQNENSPCPAHRRWAAFIWPLLTRPDRGRQQPMTGGCPGRSASPLFRSMAPETKRSCAVLSRCTKDRYAVSGSVPDTIDGDWIETVDHLEDVREQYPKRAELHDDARRTQARLYRPRPSIARCTS